MKAEENLGGLLGKSSRLMSNALDAHLKDLRLTSQQWSLMAELAFAGGRNQTELARALLKNKASVGSLIDYLETKNCIARTASPTDRREIIIELTPTGQAIFERSKPLAGDIITRATNGINRDEQAIAQRVLKQIIQNLESSQ